MGFTAKMGAYARIIRRGLRNRTDLSRYLVRRPVLLGGMGMYETALLVGSRIDPRLTSLASVRAASLVGCPF